MKRETPSAPASRFAAPSASDRGLQARVAAIVDALDPDPFSFLGMHLKPSGELVVRTFLPGAEAVSIVDGKSGEVVASLGRLHEAGVFAGVIAERPGPFRYRLRIASANQGKDIEDPYAFPPTLDDADLRQHVDGDHWRGFEMLGAHPMKVAGVEGTRFVVWAPNARRVSVVGDFNAWDGRRHPMRFHPLAGIWEIFMPAVGPGALYKYEIRTAVGEVVLKSDPYAFQAERAPRTASIVHGLPAPAPASKRSNDRRAPISIYEVHLGSWRRNLDEDGRALTYRELAETLVPYVASLGFTHIELMPISEYPFDGSWGYQPTALFAPTSRYGSPDDFCVFVERCHQHGLGVILDWVAAHFPSDAHGLARFDGSCLYEHSDPREGLHPDWDTLIYNYGRNEVRSFLLSNAIFWLERYGVDGLRVDAVASMLYRNYSRREGEWIPNRFGGVENLEAVDFLRRMNEVVYAAHPDAATFAEESTAWPMVSRPTYLGGLGFGYKWNLGWMHDTLDYMAKDPVHRRYHHNELTFGLLYAFDENFVLPLSHDEVVHGKGSLLGKMPGDRWRRFANLRCYLAFQFTQPGKKLLFMGGEFGQEREWSHDRGLDWDLLADPAHAGVRDLVRDLNQLYASLPCLHEMDCEPGGFSWIDCHDHDNSVISYIRRAADPEDFAIVVCNFTPVVRHGYRVGVPAAGGYRERLNTDSAYYGGTNAGNEGDVGTETVPTHGFPNSLNLVLPPLAVLILQPQGRL